MTLVATTFDDLITFNRGTGATRVNDAGLIVGVDFSSTSITFGTGSKAFTLTADANVNRDWPIGEPVIAVSQAAPLGDMTGTVTAYDPATQLLTIDVASSTGTGTSTNWRIGSLEVRRDADGVLREPMRSNLFTRSQEFENASWTKLNATVTANATLSLDGSINADKLIGSSAGVSAVARQNATVVANQSYMFGVFVKRGESDSVSLYGQNQGLGNFKNFTLTDADFTTAANGQISYPNGWKLIYIVTTATTSGTGTFNIEIPGSRIVNAGLDGLFVWQADLQAGNTLTSPIPTTTVAVTRNADTFTFTPAAIAKFRQGQGALVVEANASDAGTAQRAALRLTGPAGEIRFGKQGVATSGNFTKMAEGGDVQLLGNATQGVTNNGLEYSLINPIETRTGNPVGPFSISSVAYDGSTSFGVTTGGNGESVLPLNLSQADGKGIGGGTTLHGAHYNGSRFIIATGTPGMVVISTDGLSYRRVNTPVITQVCNEVTSGDVGGTLRNVIVGEAGFIATSDDNGETWVSRTSGTTQNLFGVSFGTLAATGYFITAGNSGTLRYSTDAITWANGTGQGAGVFVDVHIANNIAVAVGVTGTIFTSTNGTSWAAATSSGVVTPNAFRGVHYNASANLWVAVGNAGTIITATDPTGTWTLQTSGVGNDLLEVNYFNGLWIASIAGANTILTSPNAVTWTLRFLNPNGTQSFSGIAASATRLITTGASGTFFSSEDGITYTSRTNNNQTLTGIAYGAGVYVSVGNAVNGSGYIATIDGAGTVTRRVSGTASSIRNVKFVNGAFYAPHGDLMLRSVDGVTWANTTISLPMAPSDITIGNGLFVLVGLNANRRYATSTDGINFTVRDIVATSVLQNAVDFANGVFVSVGNTGTILTGVESSGSVTWTLRTSGTTQNLTSVMFSTRDQRWYAAGVAGTLLYSDDNGVTWASVNNAGFGAVSNTTLQASKLANQWASGDNKIALSYSNNNVVLALNGSAVSDTLASIPEITAGVLGETFNGKITSVRFRPEPLTEAQAATITEL